MSATTVRVKPVQPGSNLRHPAGGRPLSDDGDVWPNDGWTQRRIAEGGVVIVPDDPPQNMALQDETPIPVTPAPPASPQPAPAASVRPTVTAPAAPAAPAAKT